MPRLAPPNAHTLEFHDQPYLQYQPPPDIVSDATLLAIVQAVSRTITELAASGELDALLPVKKTKRPVGRINGGKS
jgi:hypothetical protein